ncbi:hypothetical protein V6N13_057253 [Hibiscus sabdariffa]
MHRSNHHLLRRVDTLSLPFTGSVVPGASRFMLRSPQESEWEYRRGPGDENDASTVKRIIKCWLQLRVCSCSVKGSQLMFKRLCKLTTIASYGPSHPSYEEESESENGMKGESNAFRRESSDNSRENEPKERETGNAFSTYGFSRGPLGVLRNQVCQRKTMTLSLNMLPMNKESHSICHLFPRCRSLIKQSQAEKQKALHQGSGSLSRLRSNSTSRTGGKQSVHCTSNKESISSSSTIVVRGVRVRSGELRQNVPIGSGELLLDWLGTLKDLFSRVVFVRNKKVARGLYSQARKLAPSSSPIFAPLPDKAHPFAESFLPKKEE